VVTTDRPLIKAVFYRDLDNPAPEDKPEVLQRQFCIAEPSVTGQAEPAAAEGAPVPNLLRKHFS